MKKWVNKGNTIFGHLLAITIILFVFWSAAAYFLFGEGLIGVDSNHFSYFVAEYSRRLPFPPAGWRMAWFEGIPQMLDYPWFNFYLIQPLVKLVGVMPATKIYLVSFLFLFLLFSYLVFWELSGSILLSAALSVTLSRSWAVYTQLYDAGVGLASIAQVAWPATLYFLLRFLKEKKGRWLGLAIMATSFGFYSNDLLTGFFVFIPALLFLFFCSFSGESFLNRPKVLSIWVFALGVMLLSQPPLMGHIIDVFSGVLVRLNLLGTLGHTSQVGWKHLFEETNISFFIFLPIAIIWAPFFGTREKTRTLVALGMVLLYFLLIQLANTLGLNPAIGVLFPHRSFWLFPLMLGALMAVLLGGVKQMGLVRKITVWLLAILIIGTSLFKDFQSLAYKDFGNFAPGIREVLKSGLPRYKTENLFKTWSAKSITDLTEVPLDFFETQDLNHRLYVYDHGTRILWNIFFPVPQTYGYFHYYDARSANWMAWLYAAFSRENFEEGGIPADIARQQSLFLADWYGVRYLITKAHEEMEVAPHFYEDAPYILAKTASQAPAGIELSPEFVSEIARPSKQPVLGFVGDDQAYDYLLRNLGMLNLNSNYLIPIRLANFVEDLTPERLAGIDGLIVYDYRKKKDSEGYQEGWKRLAEFVRDGGVIFVETGAGCPEKWGEKIPELFPISQLDSGSLGKAWDIETTFFKESDFRNLSPLTYQEGFWAVSFVPSDSLVRPGAKILLKQAGKPVVVESLVGKGKVIWSGLNLFYRPLHHQETALAETQLLRGILGELASLKRSKIDFTFNRPRQEKVILNFTGGHGALLKENNYGGWIAQAEVNGKRIRLPVLSAGPDFMYAPLPKEFWNQQIKIEFIYQGLWYYRLFFIIAIVTFIFLLDLIILNQKIFSLFFLPIKAKVNRTREIVKKRWSEEEV